MRLLGTCTAIQHDCCLAGRPANASDRAHAAFAAVSAAVIVSQLPVLSFLYSKEQLGLIDVVSSDPDRILTVANYIHSIHMEVRGGEDRRRGGRRGHVGWGGGVKGWGVCVVVVVGVGGGVPATHVQHGSSTEPQRISGFCVWMGAVLVTAG